MSKYIIDSKEFTGMSTRVTLFTRGKRVITCDECRFAKREGGLTVCQRRYPYCFTNPFDYCSGAEARHA